MDSEKLLNVQNTYTILHRFDGAAHDKPKKNGED